MLAGGVSAQPDITNTSRSMLLPARPSQAAISPKQIAKISVSSNIRIAARRPRVKAPVIKRFVPRSSGTGIIVSHSTDLTGKTGSITLTMDLGPAVTAPSKAKVNNAPAGLTFSEIVWPKISNMLPNGVSVTKSQKAGSPEYPMLEVTFAIPGSAHDITPILQPLGSAPLGNVHLPPAPILIKGTALERDFDAKSYQAAWTPTPSIGKPLTFRSLRTVTVRIPIASGPSTQVLALRKFTVGITFEFNGKQTASAVRDPLFEGLNAHIAANSWDLAKFSIPLRPSRPIPMRVAPARGFTPQGRYDSTSFGWIDPSAQYVKLSVTRDGLYRVTPQQILSGPDHFDLAQQHWTSQAIRCINRGIEIPIWIDTGVDGTIAAIEFYGQHLPGFADEHEYYNVATDTNAYWLTISNKTGGVPLRYRPKSPQLASTTISSGNILLHHERDFFYYEGDEVNDDENTIHPTEYVPGERFTWTTLLGPNFDPNHPGDTSRLFDTFYIAKLPANVQGKSAALTMFVRGMTPDGHRVVVRVNGQMVDDTTFDDHDSVVLHPSFPLSELREGQNIIEVLSAGTPSQTDEFYLDYYTVSYEGGLSASTDTAIVKGQWLFGVSPGARVYQLAMNATDTLHLYNLSDGTRILPQSAAYADSTSLPKSTYAVATSNSLLTCDRISLWNLPTTQGWQILNTQDQADYIIITHPEFLGEAQRLAARRAAVGLKSMVVTTDEVFNAFDFGSNEPDAIRRFLNYAYYYYQGTPVSYVTLLGSASWDSKFNLNNTLHDPSDRSTQHSFVPTYGWPVSDFYFTLTEDGVLDTIQPHMVIGRIPVASTEQADAYLTKLVEYESAAPAEWNRHFLFIAGGASQGEHEEFMNEIQTFLGSASGDIGMNMPPMNIRDTIVEKSNPTTSDPDNSHVGEIESLIREGLGLIHFAGHGATFITDVILPDPSNLRNQGLYPLLLTGSCRTGAFAEYNQVTLNETYIRQPEAGSVMAFGTTGFGEIFFDYSLSFKFFSLMDSFRYMHDYPRIHSDTTKPELMNLTAMLTAAKLYAADSSSSGQYGLNSRLQYSILGDAALGFCLRPQPEFAVHAPEIEAFARDSLPKKVFNLTDTEISISALIHNFGYSAEGPVVVEIQDIGPAITYSVFDTLPYLNDSTRVSASFSLTKQSVGEHTITITIDPDRHYKQLDTANETASITILVNGLSVTNFYPYEGSRGFCDISSTESHFIVLLPVGSTASDQVELQIDTAQEFMHPFDKDTAAGTRYFQQMDAPLTSVPIPSTGVYWWRSRLVKANGTMSDWEYATFSTAPSSQSEFCYNSSEQLTSTIESGLAVQNGKLYLPLQNKVRYEVISHGINDTNIVTFNPVSEILINDHTAFTFQENGYIIAPLTADGSRVDTEYVFIAPDYGDSVSQARMVIQFDSVIGSIKDSTRVIVFTNLQPQLPWFSNDLRVQAAMQTLGSKQGFYGINTWGSYALIGMKGEAPGMAREMMAPAYSGGSDVKDTIVTLGTSGTAVTPFTAVSRGYGMFKWSGDPIPPGSYITFNILGSRRDGTGIDLLDTLRASTGLQTSTLDLSKIDSRRYDRLAVRVDFERTSNATQSPMLSDIELAYDAAPEFIFTTDALSLQPSQVQEGQSVIASYGITTLTCAAADSIIIPLVRQSDTIVLHKVPHLNGHASLAFTDTVQTVGEQGAVTLTATVNPNEAQNEQLLYNNTISGSYSVTADSIPPHVEILMDQEHIPQYGFVPSRDTITINLYSTNFVRVTDTNSIIAEILPESNPSNFVDVSVANPHGYKVTFYTLPSGPLQAVLQIVPGVPFTPGKWWVTAYTKDASGNRDTVVQKFTVSAVNGLDHVMNYPNPFKDKTDFTFMLMSDGPASVKIFVYTIAGRKIRTLTPSNLHAGFNMVEWDGRDEQGNDIANGTYLYRVTINGTNPDGSTVSDGVTEAAVRAR